MEFSVSSPSVLVHSLVTTVARHCMSLWKIFSSEISAEMYFMSATDLTYCASAQCEHLDIQNVQRVFRPKPIHENVL